MERGEGSVEAASLALAGRLTERDRWLCRLLLEHQVLTTVHIRDLAFDSLTTTRHRLHRLHGLGVLDRFRPLRPAGSADYHYVLGAMGAAVVAAERGVELGDIGWRADRALVWAASQRLEHLLGINSFFSALVLASRLGRGQLGEWWSEYRCAAALDCLVRPDAYGMWREGTHGTAFFLEYDRGTERLGRLAAKLDDYRQLALAGVSDSWVLFRFPSLGREREARRALGAAGGLRVATAGPCDHDPAGAAWLPLRADRRLCLAVLDDANAPT